MSRFAERPHLLELVLVGVVALAAACSETVGVDQADDTRLVDTQAGDTTPPGDTVSPGDTTPPADTISPADTTPPTTSVGDTRVVDDGDGVSPIVGCLAGDDASMGIAPDHELGRVHVYNALGGVGVPGRRIRVVVPETYSAEPERRFPVVYMHDGQNLFEDSEAAFGSAWHADDVVDALAAASWIEPHILVGVDNTSGRNTEYTPVSDPEYGGGGGDAYADYIADVVRALVDARYRTRCGPDARAVVGSSLGGLISLHIGRRHAALFGRVGALSPSLWWDDGSVQTSLAPTASLRPMRLWLDAGTSEGGATATPGLRTVVADARAFLGGAVGVGMRRGADLGYLEELWASHEEVAWSRRLTAAFGFLLSDRDLTSETPTRRQLTPFVPVLAAGEGTPVALEVVYEGGLRVTAPMPAAGVTVTGGAVTRVASDRVAAASMGTSLLSVTHGGAEVRGVVAVDGADVGVVEIFVTTPAGTPDGPIFVAANHASLGEWRPDGVGLAAVEFGQWVAYVALPIGTELAFKVTRGSWDTVEKAGDGSEVGDTTWTVTGDGRVEHHVATWADR